MQSAGGKNTQLKLNNHLRSINVCQSSKNSPSQKETGNKVPSFASTISADYKRNDGKKKLTIPQVDIQQSILIVISKNSQDKEVVKGEESAR